MVFLSTPSEWRATSEYLTIQVLIIISIHALRVEGDLRPHPSVGHCSPISIHALRVEGDVFRLLVVAQNTLFLSTPSEWRATFCNVTPKNAFLFLSTPSEWRATSKLIQCKSNPLISIHALRVEGDTRLSAAEEATAKFLSTPSEWRATAKTDKVFACFCAKGRRICLFKTRKERICRWRFKKDKFWLLIWCEGSGKSVCALASHCG